MFLAACASKTTSEPFVERRSQTNILRSGIKPSRILVHGAIDFDIVVGAEAFPAASGVGRGVGEELFVDPERRFGRGFEFDGAYRRPDAEAYLLGGK
jgi:hypothetical protein